MKFFDLMSDKIDYLFRRGKNADERTYDFFIRTITFLILALIILCYGSFVHADNSTLLSHFDINTSEVGNWLAWSSDNYNKFNNLRFNTSDIDYPVGSTGSNDINNLVYADGMDLNNNYIFIEDSQYSWFEVWLIPKNLIDNGNIVAKYVGNVVVYDSDNDYTVTRYAIDYVNQTDPTKYSITNQTITQGYGFYAGSLEPWTGYHTVFSNAPVYNLPNMDTHESIRSWVSNGMEEDFSNYLMNNNYYNYDTDLLDQPWDNIDPVESNANHNYLNDIQIGLTSQNIRQNILSSQVIIGCDVDDWILNHLDDYSLYINYKIHIKDSYQSSPNDPDFDYSVILPLRTFYNNAYTYSVAELFRNCTNSSNQSFQSYFNIVGEGQRILSEQPYNAIIPCFLETIYQGLGKYYVAPDPEFQTIPYTIFQFKLDVSCSLTYQGMSSDDASGIYLKEFDFKNCSESVKVADILRNDNPWEGESEPQQSPIVPSAGGSPSGNGSSGSVNVNVDVSGQKIPIGVKTKQEIQIILDNYKEVNDTFMDNWEDLSDPNNDNNFMSFISDETKELPAVDYMIKGACAIFGLSIILFVLKVLLF